MLYNKKLIKAIDKMIDECRRKHEIREVSIDTLTEIKGILESRENKTMLCPYYLETIRYQKEHPPKVPDDVLNEILEISLNVHTDISNIPVSEAYGDKHGYAREDVIIKAKTEIHKILQQRQPEKPKITRGETIRLVKYIKRCRIPLDEECSGCADQVSNVFNGVVEE